VFHFSEVVYAPVSRDLVEPGGKLGGRLIPLARFNHLEKYILVKLLSLIAAFSDKMGDEIEDTVLMAPVEDFKRALIAPPVLQHQFLIALLI
jgi:hypothetical protein